MNHDTSFAEFIKDLPVVTIEDLGSEPSIRLSEKTVSLEKCTKCLPVVIVEEFESEKGMQLPEMT